LGFQELISIDHGLQDSSKNYLKHIKIAGNFLNKLVEDILDLTNTQLEQDQELQEISLYSIIQEEIAAFKVISDTKNIFLEFTYSEESKIKILGNQISFQRILQNLLSNSFKFTNYGGKISIYLYTKDSKLVMELSDNGVGISKDQLNSILLGQKLVSTKGTLGEKGSGLGLSIVKRLVEKNRGQLEIESEEKKGTTFKSTFPLVSP
jgi:signal transduction histidine kinase